MSGRSTSGPFVARTENDDTVGNVIERDTSEPQRVWSSAVCTRQVLNAENLDTARFRAVMNRRPVTNFYGAGGNTGDECSPALDLERFVDGPCPNARFVRGLRTRFVRT